MLLKTFANSEISECFPFGLIRAGLPQSNTELFQVTFSQECDIRSRARLFAAAALLAVAERRIGLAMQPDGHHRRIHDP